MQKFHDFYNYDYIIKWSGNDYFWHITQEDIRKNRREALCEFAATHKTLAERMLEDSEEYGKWLDAQKPETNSFNMRQSLNKNS